MCNACGFYCCASDTFDKCGCDHCPCSECWSDEEDDDYDNELGVEYDEPYQPPALPLAHRKPGP